MQDMNELIREQHDASLQELEQLHEWASFISLSVYVSFVEALSEGFWTASHILEVPLIGCLHLNCKGRSWSSVNVKYVRAG